MDEARVVLRDFDQDRDQALIYATWRNQLLHSPAEPLRDRNNELLKKDRYGEYVVDASFKQVSSDFTKMIRATLESAQVKIACLSDDPQNIIGYSVSRGDHQDFIYVKASYRRQKIGTLLMPKDIKTVSKYMTETGKKLAEKKNLTKEI